MRIKWQTFLAFSLVLVSFLIYSVQINIFHDLRDTVFYFFQDIAFIPIQVLLVTLIIDQLLEVREKEAFLKKLNMVIGVFFSECGSEIIRFCLDFDRGGCLDRSSFAIDQSWSDKDYKYAAAKIGHLKYSADLKSGDILSLRDFLMGKRDLMLRLLENPNLLEHDSFSDMLLAISHLTEELELRKDLGRLSQADAKHLAIDIERVFASVLRQWLSYMKHLKDNYPYLYSLSVRMNPFSGKCAAEIG